MRCTVSDTTSHADGSFATSLTAFHGRLMGTGKHVPDGPFEESGGLTLCRPRSCVFRVTYKIEG